MHIPWPQATLVAFDTETSGKYPLESDICEVAAVKWKEGQVIDTFQSFVRIRGPMPKPVIEIHHITDEMLIGAPHISDVVVRFHEFLKGAVPMAHHAPFDLGFLTPEFERVRLPLLQEPILCTSLLSRKIFPDSENHRLSTLTQYLNIDAGQAHRALDDSKTCLSLALKCFEKMGPTTTIQQLIDHQGVDLRWGQYSMADLRAHPVFSQLILAIESRSDIQIIYQGGSRPGEARTVKAVGLVRNHQGDFFVAYESNEPLAKRYFLNKITAARL